MGAAAISVTAVSVEFSSAPPDPSIARQSQLLGRTIFLAFAKPDPNFKASNPYEKKVSKRGKHKKRM